MELHGETQRNRVPVTDETWLQLMCYTPLETVMSQSWRGRGSGKGCRCREVLRNESARGWSLMEL